MFLYFRTLKSHYLASTLNNNPTNTELLEQSYLLTRAHVKSFKNSYLVEDLAKRAEAKNVFEKKTLIKNFKKVFDSIMLPKEEAEDKNYLRLLEVDYRLVLPSKTYVRIEVTSEDVIHS